MRLGFNCLFNLDAQMMIEKDREDSKLNFSFKWTVVVAMKMKEY